MFTKLQPFNLDTTKNYTFNNVAVNLITSNNAVFSGSNVALGSVSNLHVYGGTTDQLIKTDGAGNLSFTQDYGLLAYNKANDTNILASAGYAMANAANNTARTVYGQSNSIAQQVSSLQLTVEATDLLIQSVNEYQNTRFVSAETLIASGFDQANAANNLATSGYTKANNGNSLASSAYGQANATNEFATSGFGRANTAYTKANNVEILTQSSYALANAANNLADAAFFKANSISSGVSAGEAMAAANAANNLAAAAFFHANTQDAIITAAYTHANSQDAIILASYVHANATDAIITSSYAHANSHDTVIFSAYQHANNAFNYANTIIGGGGSSGDPAAYAQANAATVSAQAAYNKANAVGTFSQVGFDKANAAFAYANTIVGGGGSSGDPAAYAQANAATVSAQAAYNKANSHDAVITSSYTQANNGVTSAAAAFDKSNNNLILINAAYNQANTDYTTLSATAGSFGDSSNIPVITLESNGRVSAISTSSITIPAGTSIYGASGQITANAATGIVQIGLATTAVTPGSYTSSSITVDAYGRITAASSGAGGGGGSISVTDEVTIDSSAYYPLLATVSTGSLSTANTSSTKLYYNPFTGTLNSTIFNSLSDENIKTNKERITDALLKLSQLGGYTYMMIDSGEKSAGLIAQEVQKVLPEAVSYTPSLDLLTLNYNAVLGLVVQSINELEQRVKDLENGKL